MNIINKLGERGRAYFGFEYKSYQTMRIYVKCPYLIGKNGNYVRFYVRKATATHSDNYGGYLYSGDSTGKTFYYDYYYGSQRGKYMVDIYRNDGTDSNAKHVYIDEIIFTI